MSWLEAKKPEDVFGYRDKPFRLTGYYPSYFDLLNSRELSDLSLIHNVLSRAAGMEASVLHILLVGSTAAFIEHGDIDLLVCSEPSNSRLGVATNALEMMKEIPFRLQVGCRKGSVDSFASSLLLPTKIYASSHSFWNMFDISFVSQGSGSWENVLDFHKRTNLSHAIVV